jgi:acyl-coenzyme A thioesterase PaaI-like protein
MTASRIELTATAIHQGRTQQLCQVGIVDEAGRRIAAGHVRLHNAGPRT